MNNGLFTYLAALLLFGSNGIIAAAIALPSSNIVLLRTFLGALSLVTVLAITQRHKLQAPSRPREAAALLLSGAALGASWIFLFPRLSDDRRRRILAAVLLRPHHRHGALPAHLWRKADRRQNRRLYRRRLRCFSHCGTRSRRQHAHCGHRLRNRLGILLCTDGHCQQGSAAHRGPRKLHAPGERRLCDRAGPHARHPRRPLVPLPQHRRQASIARRCHARHCQHRHRLPALL